MYRQTVEAIFVAVLWSSLYTFSTSCNITLGKNGTFTLSVFSNETWLDSGPISLMHKKKWFTTEDGSLEFVGDTSSTPGQDVIGHYTEYSFRYKAGDVTMETSIKQYQTPAVIVFTQRFPQGVTGSRFELNKTMSGFPSVRVGDTSASLGYLSFGSFMFGDMKKTFSKWSKGANINDGMDGSAPLLLYDKSGRVILISPFNQFMASSMWHDKDNAILNWGIMGGVDNVPAGFETSTIAFCSDAGIRETFNGWGQVMRQVYQKTDQAVNYHRMQDITLTHLGYWTDNGAYYYYYDKTTEEDALLSVKHWSIRNHVPYKYYQLDSWFYPKDNLAAVTTWDAMESIFPKGLKAFQDRFQVPLAAHNRYWSVNTTYAKQNGGYFDFIINTNLSLPVEQLFWDYLVGHGKEEWGLVLYEQDWLNVQTLFFEDLYTNLTLGHLWLTQMAQAAVKHGVKVQYCMALSRHALSTLHFPVVTQARVSNDYLLEPEQWKIGVTSHFVHAMGVAPSKDTFWTTGTQAGNRYNKDEPHPSLQTVVAVLSTGPVGPGDKIDSTNIPMLMRCCDNNGQILKPSVPAKAIDDQFIEMSFQDGSGASGEIWSTYSTQLNALYGVVLVANLSRDYVITPKKAGFLSSGLPQFSQSVLYSIENNTAVTQDPNVNSSSQFTIHQDSCKTDGEFFCLFYTSPLLTVGVHSVALLGDLTKWVPMSEQRVVHVWQKAGGLAVTLRGRRDESISFTCSVNQTISTKTGKADDKECVTFTLISGSEPLYPEDIDCRFRAPPITTVGPETTTHHHGNGAQGRRPLTLTSSLHCTWLIFICWTILTSFVS